MQIRESAAATAGGANRNAQGVKWGEGEESVRHCMCPHPHQRHKGRTETGPQSRAREASSRGMSASLLASGDRQDLRDPGALGKDAGP